MMSAPGSGANCLLAEWLQVLGVELPVTGRGMPFIGVRQAQQSWLVRNSSVSYTRHCLPSCLLRDTVGVLGLPLQQLLLKLASPYATTVSRLPLLTVLHMAAYACWRLI